MTFAYWAGRRVLVTGHTGFKGAWLCLLLHRLGAVVAGYALPPPTHPSLYELAAVGGLVESTIGDVRDLQGVTAAIQDFRPEVVIHMAAQSVVLDSYQDPVGTYSTNVLGTVNVLEAIRLAGRGLTMVNVTTDKCYENHSWVWSYRENDSLGGRDPYSNSKACSELVSQTYRRSFFPIADICRHGVAISCARAGNVIGGGDWTPHQLVPAVVAAFSGGRPVLLRHPDAIRPWQHVLDCLAGYLMLAESTARKPADFAGDWNFGPSSEEVYTVAQVAEALASHWGVEPAWERAPAASPPEERELRLDCSKANRLLGWRCRLPTAVALEWVADWYIRSQAGVAARDVCESQIDAYLESEQRRSS